ncbi:MAG: glutamate--tRNA ligase [Actinomycetota bacterium]|nr:glutamate--tRNA ligase [Actinomycetota bacterium]
MTSATGAPRVRFAPSPTGYFHVGGARTALYNWLVARRGGGTFVLRIEDTDRERSDDSFTEGILSALRWIGVDWDEGPYRQSERRALYDTAAEKLVASGRAYACDCTRADVDARTSTSATPGYDGFCRDRGLEPGPGRALRFRVPDSGVTVVHDVVRGDVEFANSTIEDFVVVKSNGDPLFVLAVVVDDVDMAITHVIRAEEHLPTTPKAVLLWEALGAGPLPVFAHLPVLVNEKRQKLSKRRDRVALEDYRALGYLPEAMRNYLALLGWAPADGREVLTVDELVEEFRLEDVNRSPAFFDEKRLAHFNGLYLRALPVEEFEERCAPFVAPPATPWPGGGFDAAVFSRLAPLVQERVATLGEVPALVGFAFADPFEVDEAAFAKAVAGDEGAEAILRASARALATGPWEAEPLKEALVGVADGAGRKLGKAQAPVRVATMGSTVGLPLFESLEVLGRDRTLSRIESALSRLGATG